MLSTVKDDEKIMLEQLVIYADELRKLEQENSLLKLERFTAAAKIHATRKILHEIKNPLTPIRLISERILRRAGGVSFSLNDVCTDLKQILDMLDHIQYLMRDFSTFIKLGDIKKEPTNLIELIVELREMFNTEKHRFIFHCEEPMPCITADPMLIKIALMNIFKNALEALPCNGGKVIIHLSRKKNKISLTVTDNGSGMDCETLKRIGEPYFTTKDNGTGLGTSIVYTILKRHGFNITYHSAPGKGTRVEVSI